MNICIVLGLLICILYIITSIFIVSKDKKDKFFFNVSFVIIFIALLIREPYSDLIDFLAYFRFYRGDFSLLNLGNFAFLYKLLNVLVFKVWYNERFFMFIVDLISISGPYFFIKKYSKNYFVSLLVFIAFGTYSMQFYVIRQALAISFLLLSVKFIEEKKFTKYLIMNIVAVLFHKSAIVFFPIYFLRYVKFKKDYIFFFMFLFGFLFIFKDELCLLLMRISGYSNYIGTKFDIKGDGFWRLSIFITIFMFCIFSLKKEKINETNSLFLNVLQLSIYLILIATSSSTFIRVANYFCFPIYILLGNSINSLSNNKTRFLMNLLFTVIYFLFCFIANPITGYTVHNYL